MGRPGFTTERARRVICDRARPVIHWRFQGRVPYMRSHRWLTVVLTLVLGASPLRASAARVRADSTLAAGSVSGVIRSSTGEPIRGANVEVLGTGRRTVADTSGGYALRSLQVGRGTLRFSSASHDPLTLDVVVPPGSNVRVDVVLTAAVASLPTVHIPPQSGSRAAAPNGSAWSVGNGGAWQWQGDVATSAMSTGEPDVFRVLASNPHVSLRPEWSGTFTDRGARSDETLFLVDGIPVWNPVHAVGVLSAISPDIVGGLNLNDGVMSARNGGRLSGVLNVETRERAIDAPLASAAIGPAAARLAWGAPFAMGSNTGGVLVALRRSDNGALGTGADPSGATDPWSDGFHREPPNSDSARRTGELRPSERGVQRHCSFECITPSAAG